MALFSHGLLPASFRGVPFAVLASEVQTGRRIAAHIYPGRDEPWMEDMGRAPRSYRMRGFIVANDVVYLGGPVQLQRALIIAAAEKSGSGLLTHPTLGILQVVCRSYAVSEDLGAGSASEISFEFVESGKKSFPSLLTSSSGLLTAANLAKVAIAIDCARVLSAALSSGGDSADVLTTTQRWSDRVEALGYDATALQRLAAQAPGNFGRFGQGGNVGLAETIVTPYQADVSINALIAVASAQRANIAVAARSLSAAIIGLTVTTSEQDIAAAAGIFVGTLFNACADPVDALRLLDRLLTFEPIGQDVATVVGGAIGDIFRRHAAVALANAIATYQPASYDDAFAKLQLISGRLDAEITIAADSGLDDTFNALRAVRVAVVQDLRRRGASLAPIRGFTTATPTPALVLAQRFYRDAARADQIVRQVDVPHPLFMPTSFRALAA